MKKISKASLTLAVSAFAIIVGSTAAQAVEVSQDQLTALQNQIQSLQKQLDQVKAAQKKDEKTSCSGFFCNCGRGPDPGGRLCRAGQAQRRESDRRRFP